MGPCIRSLIECGTRFNWCYSAHMSQVKFQNPARPHVLRNFGGQSQTHVRLPCCYEDCRDLHHGTHLQTTTQDCIHTVWKGFDTIHRRLLTPCSSASHHQERGLLEFAARRSAGSYTPKSRSINLIRKSPPQRRIYLDVETSTFIAPSGRHPTASYTLSNGGCEPSKPPIDPTNLSLCPKSHQMFAAPRVWHSGTVHEDFDAVAT